MFRVAILLLFCSQWCVAIAADDKPPLANYIANMGVMIEHGDTKILFDPLFRNDYDIYDRVPTDVEALMLAGQAPFDDIEAVFISHHHGDHFDPATILGLLAAQQTIELFGPEQAAAAIRKLVEPNDPVLERIHGLSLENGAPAIDIELGPLLVEAVRVPHSGWPNYHPHVENLVFRVTLEDATTVTHFGDADPVDEHYAKNQAHWMERKTHFAMPPYWFFFSDEGRQILEERVGAVMSIGMHVPTKIPADPASRQEELRDVDLFTNPGETRVILTPP